MAVKYLTDESGVTTDVQLPLKDYLQLLEDARQLPEYVRKGIERGVAQSHTGLTKSTDEVLKKYQSLK